MTPDDIAAQRALEHDATCGTCLDAGWVFAGQPIGSKNKPCPECQEEA